MKTINDYLNSLIEELREENFVSRFRDLEVVLWVETGINLMDIKHEQFLKALKLMQKPMSMSLVVSDKVINVEGLSIDVDGVLWLAVGLPATEFTINNCNYHISHSTYSSGEFGSETVSLMDIRFIAK